jgi:hypothetical protein
MITWTRLEGHYNGRGFALQLDGATWELLIDGHCHGRFTGPDAAVNAVNALPAIMAEYPPEHPHPGLDAAPARDDISNMGRLDGSITEEG